MSVSSPSGVRSIQEQVIRPRCGPLERSVLQAGYTSARRLNSAGMPMSKGVAFREMNPGGPQGTPPSKELLKAMVFGAMSFQDTYTWTRGPVDTVVPMPLTGQFALSMHVGM